MARKPNTTAIGENFDAATIEAVWKKADPEPSSPGFSTDVCGASMQRTKYGDAVSRFGREIDHIKPAAKGGEDELDNLQPLQWENNRRKGDN